MPPATPAARERPPGPGGAPREEPRLGFPFTVRDTPALRRRIRADLTHVCRTVHREDPQAHAVVLTGGFSRGEGSARGAEPLNDYDLVVVRRTPAPRPGLYPGLASHLEDRLGLHMDLLPLWSGRLPFVTPKIFWYETKFAGRVLTGPPNLLESIPIHGPHDVPLEEAVRLLFNRATGLLEPTDPRRAGDDELVRIQASKAVLASVEALLLLHGAYHYSYRERLDRFIRLLPELDDPPGDPHALAKRAELATRFKLTPRLADDADPRGMWRDARETLLATLRHVTRRGGWGGVDGYLHRRGGVLEAAYYWANALPRDHARLTTRPSLRAREACLALLEAARLPPEPPGDTRAAREALEPLLKRGAPEGFHRARDRFFQVRGLTLQ